MKRSLVCTTLAAFSLFCHFTNLDWGTPTQEKTNLIFEDSATLEKFVPRMMQQREDHYSGIKDILDPQKSFQPAFEKLFRKEKEILPFSKIDEETILDRTRGYLIGAYNSDEQNTIRAISNLKPQRLQLNPGLNSFYGGFYYYTSGAFLLTAKLLGLGQFPSDLKFYFIHPEETQKIYIAVRLLSALSVFLTLVLLLFFVRKFIDSQTSLLAALFFVSIPLLVPYSHMAKAHAYGMFLLFAGFLFISRTFVEINTRNYILGGFFLGLSAGSIITNLTVGSVIFIAEWIRNDWNLTQVFKSKRFWLSVFVFFSVYLLTNFYVFTHFANFQRAVLSLKEYTKGYDEYGKLNLKNWIPFIKDMFTNQMHWAILPWLILGCFYVQKSKNKFLCTILLSFLTLSIFNLTLTRHPGINLRIFPFVAILSGYGFLQTYRISKNTIRIGGEALSSFRIISITLLSLTLFLSGAQTLFYASLYSGESHSFRAGRWINQNIPEGESIGIIGAQFSQNSLPPFRFLDYSLIQFPGGREELNPTSQELPNYVVTSLSQEDHPLLSAQYRIIQSWRSPQTYLGISFPTRWTLNEKADIFIYKKFLPDH